MKVTESAVPNAAKFMREVLRGSTYNFSSAIADVIDNSIEALSTEIQIWVDYEAQEVQIIDNGVGMSDEVHREAMKIASETREYSESDLGKYGTGMKAASLSQAQRLVVGTRPQGSEKVSVRCLDMDHINSTNDWEKLTLVLTPAELPSRCQEALGQGHGTVVIWQHMDRVFADGSMDAASARQELMAQTKLAEEHLAMVFHRFITGDTKNGKKIILSINGNEIEPWDPFVMSQNKTVTVADMPLEVNGSIVRLTGYVLPSEKEFDSRQAFSAAAGPKKWNDSQGFYVYRNDRLIRWGGWLRTRASDEHTKLARIALDFSSDLDSIFQVNVAKSELTLPLAVKSQFAEPIKQVVAAAQKRYRSKIVPIGTSGLPKRGAQAVPNVERKLTATALVSLLEGIANSEGLHDELAQLKSALKRENPKIAQEIGWL